MDDKVRETTVPEPVRPKTWPPDFFDSIHITDPALVRPDQGTLPPVINERGSFPS